MTEETARMIVMGVTAVGVVAWLAGFAVMLNASRAWPGSGQDHDGPVNGEADLPGATIAGSTDVAGQPEVLASKLAERLANQGLAPFGPVKIITCKYGEMVFAASAPISAGTAGGCPSLQRGSVRFTTKGGTTHVEYALAIARPKFLLGFGWLAVAAGLTALVVAPWLSLTYALPSATARPQVIQTFQMVHFLWPPFLFAMLSRQPIRIARSQLDALIHNLPYV